MKIYINCNIAESKKYQTKAQVFLDDELVADEFLQGSDFSMIKIELTQKCCLRLHFEIVKKTNNPFKYAEICSYEELESLYSSVFLTESLEYMQKSSKEDSYDDFICPIAWTYAYDTVIENVDPTDDCLVFVFSDEFIHDDIQVADIIFPEEKQTSVKLVKCISEDKLKSKLRKRNIIHWCLYMLMILIWFPLYYGLYGMLTAPFRHLYVVQNGFLTILPYIALPISLFFIFLIWNFWKGTYRAIHQTDELALTKTVRERIKSAKDNLG